MHNLRWLIDRVKRVLGVGLIGIVLLATLVLTVGPGIAQSRLIEAVKKDCPDCTFEIASTKANFYPLALVFSDVHFKSGRPEQTQIEMRLTKASVHLDLSKVELDSLKVIVTEGDQPSPRTTEPDPGKGARAVFLRISQVRILRSELIYSRVHAGRSAEIMLSDIHGQLDVANEIQASIKGRLEKSGSFEVDLKMPPTFKDSDLEVKLKILNQKLPELNAYFHPAEGLRLSGVLHQGVSQLTIQNHHLKAWVKIKYEDLDIHFEKTAERSRLKAFFSNLGKSIVLKTESIKNNPDPQADETVIKRTPDEAIFHFIFRGLAKALTKVI